MGELVQHETPTSCRLNCTRLTPRRAKRTPSRRSTPPLWISEYKRPPPHGAYLPNLARNLFEDNSPGRPDTTGAEDAPTTMRDDLLSQLDTQSALSPAIRTIACTRVNELDERG